MNGIQLMVEEHKNIMRMLRVMRKASYKILDGEAISFEDFDKMIDFVRKYADEHHHGKEEKILFREMVDNLGTMGNKLITHGMLVEHDWGRLYISELTAALELVKAGESESRLDVIANAVGYANHLARHISKEDSVVYTFAQRQLKPEILESVNRMTDFFEQEAEQKGIQVHYMNSLKELEAKYLN